MAVSENEPEIKLDRKRKEVHEKLDAFLEDPRHEPFYRWSFIQTNELYHDGPAPCRCEVIAKWMLGLDEDELDELLCDPKPELESAEYADGKRMRDPKTTARNLKEKCEVGKLNLASEDTICKELYLSYCPGGGAAFEGNDAKSYFIIDYQVPVNRIQGSTRSCIDLLIRSGDTLLVGEAKKENSKESLLRAATETTAYCRRITATPDARAADKAREEAEPGKRAKTIAPLYRFKKNYGSDVLIPAVLLFKTMRAWQDYELMRDGEYAYQRDLFASWGVRFFEVTGIDEPPASEQGCYPEREGWLLKRALKELPQPWRKLTKPASSPSCCPDRLINCT